MPLQSIRRLIRYAAWARYPLSALTAGLLAAACVPYSTCDCTDPLENEEEEWSGLASAACGPADGPAVRFQIDTAAYSGCGTQHPGESATLVGNSGYADILQPGKIFLDTQSICPGEKCANRTVIRIEILSVDSASVKADIRIESNATGSNVIRSGKATLTRCPNQGLCG
jgi:hypothetical protein